MSKDSYGPYSSREMHKYVRYGVNKKDGSRVVEKPSFVSFGSKEKPEPYKAGKNELPDRWKYKKWESPRVPVNAGEGYFGWPPQKGAPKDATFKAFEYPGGKKEMKLEYVDKCSYRNAKRPDKVAFQVCLSFLIFPFKLICKIFINYFFNILFFLTFHCICSTTSQKMRLEETSLVLFSVQSNIAKA